MIDTLPSDESLRYLRALGDPDRLKIVQILRAGPRSVSDLSRELSSPIANVSHHLHALKEAGIVSSNKHGRNVIYQLDHVVETGQSGKHVLDFGCCRIEFGDGREAPAISPARPEDQALDILNRMLARSARAQPSSHKLIADASQAGIAIANPSFEEPATPFFDTNVAGWHKEGDPSSTGVFRNFPDDMPIPGSRFIQNADGEQLATLAARKGSGLFQLLAAVRFEAGKAFTLTADIGVSSVQPPVKDGDISPHVRLSLTYSDIAGRRLEAAGQIVTLAELETSSGRLTTCSVCANVDAESAFAGRPIGLLISTPENLPSHAGHFIVDHVRLSCADINAS